MANTIAKAFGHNTTGHGTKTTEAHRLGKTAAEGQANTYRTFATAYVKADGAGFVEVKRDGILLLRQEFGPETMGTSERFPKVSAVKVKWQADESPDLSYLGEFSDTWKEGAIERKDADPREYRYFIPGNHLPHDPKNWAHVPGEDKAKVIADHGSLELADQAYAEQDLRRLEACGQAWQMMGCYAEAEVLYPTQGGFRIERFQSSGLWGIESDSDRTYLKSVARDELANLKGHLTKFSVNLVDFDRLAEEADLLT